MERNSVTVETSPVTAVLQGHYTVSSGSRRQVKKIPPHLRRRKIKFSLEPLWYKRILWRLKEDSQFLRTTVQVSFVLLCIWIGIEFSLFMKWGMSEGAETFSSRPPGAEGFLPISALISLKYWIQTGIVNDVHPSGLFILLAIVAVSVLLKKAFCGWLCPVGTLSESLWMAGQKLFGRNLQPPRWLDYPLRSLKYLLLLFFGWAVLHMDVSTLQQFIYSPYNKVADIKMYLFFANIASFVLWTVLILAGLSVVIKNFWCRYLCPYGALLGFLSWFSPLKIIRTKSTCIDCELCTKACPANIKVHKVERVWSDECMSCMRCVEACPVIDTLQMRTTKTSKPVPSWVFGTLVLGVFAAITGLAMLTGNWRNGISKEEYQERFLHLDSPAYQHNRGSVPNYGPND
ncbi:MAG: 4Fe-4S binding protein [Bacteroidota bacterium]